MSSNTKGHGAGKDVGPKYCHEFSESHGELRIRGRCYTHRTDAGLVAGDDLGVVFTVDAPPRKIWPYFRDFNLWQKGLYYSGVIGDLEGKPLRGSLKPNDPGPNQYVVLRVVPEYLIVIDQPPQPPYPGVPGLGEISPGFHVFMLDEEEGRTVVTVSSSHASLMERASHDPRMTEEEAVQPWPEILQAGVRLWREGFVPTLRDLVGKEVSRGTQ